MTEPGGHGHGTSAPNCPHIDSYPVGDDTVLITRGERDYFSLLVVPPHTTPEAARAAMAQSVRMSDVAGAEQILIDTGAGRDPSA